MTGGPSQDPGAYTTDLSHALAVPINTRKPSTVVTDDCYYRIQGRIRTEFHRRSPSAWIAGAFSAATITVSALLAWIVLPRNVSNLPPGTKPTLLTIVIAAAVLTIVCSLGHRSTRKNVDDIAEDICEELEAYAYHITVKPGELTEPSPDDTSTADPQFDR